tara:strand:+ start:799 stop:1119 length:321 start_codon:yes stop_codon:yes gene_type:complete
MKKLILFTALLATASTVNAGGLFGAGLKPKPNLTLFGQKLSWAIPSLCIGAKAGVLPDAGISSDGINFKIPYLSLDLPFPSLTIKGTNSVTEVKIGAIEKTKQESK